MKLTGFLAKLPIPKVPTEGTKHGWAVVQPFINLYVGVGFAILIGGMILFGRSSNPIGKFLTKVFLWAGGAFLLLGIVKDFPLFSALFQNR